MHLNQKVNYEWEFPRAGVWGKRSTGIREDGRGPDLALVGPIDLARIKRVAEFHAKSDSHLAKLR